MQMVNGLVIVSVELEHATQNKKQDGATAENPRQGNTCSKARSYQQAGTYDVSDD